MVLDNRELYIIKGGASKAWPYALFLGIVGVVSLISGILDGIFNPPKCNIVKG